MDGRQRWDGVPWPRCGAIRTGERVGTKGQGLRSRYSLPKRSRGRSISDGRPIECTRTETGEVEIKLAPPTDLKGPGPVIVGSPYLVRLPTEESGGRSGSRPPSSSLIPANGLRRFHEYSAVLSAQLVVVNSRYFLDEGDRGSLKRLNNITCPSIQERPRPSQHPRPG